MNERTRKDLTANDVRFTTKGKTLYAFVMGWPEKESVMFRAWDRRQEQRPEDTECRSAGPLGKTEMDPG
jgi:alpha-L-fucosidase